MSNDYKSLSGTIGGYMFLKKDINADTYYKYTSYSSSDSKGKYNYSNIKGISRVYFNKQVLLV